MWTTWFHISIHDVRFHVDCILSRFFKLIAFLVMTSFVAMSPIYNTIADGGETAAFTGLALVLMAMRFIMVIQYAIVLYFVHGFHKTLVPLLLTISVYLITGFAFLGTYLADNGAMLTGAQGATHVIRWYIIVAVEALAVMTISCFWRVLSFRHTHLVERVGLLTLIVMGEGIIGLIKSATYDLLGRNASIWSEAGLITSAVIVIVSFPLLFYRCYCLTGFTVLYLHFVLQQHQLYPLRRRVWKHPSTILGSPSLLSPHRYTPHSRSSIRSCNMEQLSSRYFLVQCSLPQSTRSCAERHLYNRPCQRRQDLCRSGRKTLLLLQTN